MRNPSYGLIERWLHWIALEPTIVRHLVFDLERQIALPKQRDLNTSPAIMAEGAVYVCGLARSGTTMLLRILDQVEEFRSLTYRDMPFVLAPNLWKKITRHDVQASVAQERAHADGILVDFDSPEGFEEVFWRTFSTTIVDSKFIDAVEPTQETLKAFGDYRALVANPRSEKVAEGAYSRRYLSKNNNNLLRLRALSGDTTGTILLVYRNPFDTARSLHKQHLSFCATQTNDPFIRKYMGWLVHHEFGLDHRPFHFAVSQMDPSLEPTDINYWLDYWNAVHLYLLSLPDLRLNLIGHDAMRAQPIEMLQRIFAKLIIHQDVSALAKLVNPPSANLENTEGFNADLVSRARAIHQAVLESPQNIF